MAERLGLRHYRLIARTPFVESDADQIGLPYWAKRKAAASAYNHDRSGTGTR